MQSTTDVTRNVSGDADTVYVEGFASCNGAGGADEEVLPHT